MMGTRNNSGTSQLAGSQLRLVGDSLGEGTTPKHETLHAWSPGDSIAHAEDALAHAERKMANLKLLLNMPQRDPDGNGPWAA